MYTMIIADDESIARKSLELFIKKEFPDIRVIASVADGLELIRSVEENIPDIAIVDINMPGINGIDAIGLLNERNVETRFLINTAYSEFEYVKKALDMKVDGYLVKPGKYEEHIQIIQKLCDSIALDIEEKQKRTKIQSLLHDISPVLEKEILLSIVTDNPAVEDFEIYCGVNNIIYNSGCIVTLFAKQNLVIHKKNLKKSIDEILAPICDYLILITESSITLLLFIPIQISDKERDEWTLDISGIMVDKLDESFHFRYKVGIGKIYDDFSDISLSYHESVNSLTWDYDQEESEKNQSLMVKELKVSIYVERAISYIENHFRQDISLDMLAEQIKISPFYLSRLIKQNKGVTFIEYLTNVRIKEAKRLALKTTLPTKDIAEKSGYSNVTYFCKIFKKYTGKTIGEYRRGL